MPDTNYAIYLYPNSIFTGSGQSVLPLNYPSPGDWQGTTLGLDPTKTPDIMYLRDDDPTFSSTTDPTGQFSWGAELHDRSLEITQVMTLQAADGTTYPLYIMSTAGDTDKAGIIISKDLAAYWAAHPTDKLSIIDFTRHDTGSADYDTLHQKDMRDGIVEGTSSGDSIGTGYHDQWNDYVDHADNTGAAGGTPNTDDDVIKSYGGNDTVIAGAGNDTVYGGDGSDSIEGGAGDDRLQGWGDFDNSVDDGAADTLVGGAGNDTLLGGQGDDRLYGDDMAGTDPSGGADSIVAGAGNDTVIGGYGNDTLDGGQGNDVIDGGPGADSIAGGDGDDTILGGAGSDSIEGGNGDDYIVTGDGAADGDMGNDTVDGGAGNDRIVGGLGNDVIHGGAGNDTLDGSHATVGVAATYTTATSGTGGVSGFGTTTFDGIEALETGVGDDTIDASAVTDGGINVNTGAGNDRIIGGAGPDTMTGGDGFDTFVPGTPNTGRPDVITDFNTATGGNYADGDQSNNDFIDLSGFYNKETLAAWNAAHPDQTYASPLEWMRADQADGLLNQPPGLNLILTGVAPTDLTWDNTNVCFTAGVMIETDRGRVAAGDLKVGDRVRTRDAGFQPIRWIGSRHYSAAQLNAAPQIRPIRIAAGALGAGVPSADLLVSPQHRILVRSRIAQKMFGTHEVLVAAKQLLVLSGIDVADDAEVTYVHFLFDAHQIVFSNGAESESLYTGTEALKSVGQAARDEIFSIFPELLDRADEPAAARVLASGRMGRKLAMRHAQNGKPLVM